jgi:hypothetical protein
MINPGPTNREVQLNGSGSDDPESQRLLYHWYDGATKVGEEIVFNYHPTTGGAHTITLHVYDPAGLEGVSQSRVVVFN